MKDKNQKIGVLLLNLGGPDSLQAVTPFLYNLFSDRDIIRLGPSPLQKPVAKLISVLRSGKTRKMYSDIGGKSPILDITSEQAEKLEQRLNREPAQSGLSFRVYIGMRYWHPFIKDTIEKISKDRIDRLIVLSLYPHYSKATTGSSISEFKRAIAQLTVHGSRFTVKYIEQWYDFPAYIDAMAELIAKGLKEFNPTLPPLIKGDERGGADILYSAHSLPESFIKEGDPYLDHIKSCIDLINKRLSEVPYNINNFKWHLSFQSKTGPVKWLEPTTEKTIIDLAKRGCKNLFVVPISFVSDHIETLYEIDILYRGFAEEHGINLKRCEALNAADKFINALAQLVLSHLDI